MLSRAACTSLVLAALLSTSCSGNLAAVDPADSWAMYQRTPDHNAVIDGKTVSSNWSLDAGGQINGAMALASNTLYVDTLAGYLLAIDLPSQKIVWRAHVPHRLMSTPLLYKGMVYVGSGSNQIDARFLKFWGHRKLVMGVPGGDALYAYDAASGRLKWSYRTQGQDMPTPVLYRGMVIFANGDFHAYALDALSGRLVWKTLLPGLATMASATIANGRIIVSTCDYRWPYQCQTEALDPGTGKILWEAAYGDADSSPAYANGAIFVSGLDYRRAMASWPLVQQAYAVVAALDAATGKARWVYHDGVPGIPSDVGTSERAIAGTYANGKYFQALPGAGAIVAFDARTGKVLWRFHALAPVKMSPVQYRNRLYAGGSAGVLYVLSASTGNLLRIQTFRQPFTAAPPLIVGDTLIIAQNRTVQALSLRQFSRSAQLAPAMK